MRDLIYYDLMSMANRLDGAWIDYPDSTSGPDDDNGAILRAAAEHIDRITAERDHWRHRSINCDAATIADLEMIAAALADELLAVRLALSTAISTDLDPSPGLDMWSGYSPF